MTVGAQMQLWRWTFARLYIRSRRKWGEADSPGWSAVCGVSLIMAFNLLTCIVLVASSMGIKVHFVNYKLHAAVMVTVLLVVNHWRFVRNKGADCLIRKLAAQSRHETRVDERRLWLYMVASLVAPFIVVLIEMFIGKNS